MNPWHPTPPPKHAYVVRWTTHVVNQGWTGQQEYATRIDAEQQRDLLLDFGCVTHVSIEERGSWVGSPWRCISDD